MLADERIEKYEEEILKLKNDEHTKFYDIKILSKCRKEILDNRLGYSFAVTIYRAILYLNIDVAGIYKNQKHITGYRNLFQWEWDEIFEVCIKANKLGLEIVPKLNPNNDFSYLNSNEQQKLMEVYDYAISKYFEILLRININYLNDRNSFLNRMMKLGDIHGMSEPELVTFANKALSMGINVANITSSDELEEIYKKVFPEI